MEVNAGVKPDMGAAKQDAGRRGGRGDPAIELALDPIVELTLDAHPSVLAGLRTALGRWLVSAGASENELFDIALATSEAATNAIEHAYGTRPASFSVCCERRPTGVRVVVRDGGRWQSADSPAGGRGLTIMRQLMDSVEIERAEDGTFVTMTKRLANPTP